VCQSQDGGLPARSQRPFWLMILILIVF